MHNDKTQDIEHRFEIRVQDVDEELFTIDDHSGDVYVHRKIDREREPFFHVRSNPSLKISDTICHH